MRYLPLVWAALMRKPARAILTLLSVTVAFTLFGLMFGLSATIQGVEDRAHADRIFTGQRFGGTGLPLAMARQIASLPGVKAVSAANFVGGYVKDPKQRSFVFMTDANFAKVFPDWPPTPAQWMTLYKVRNGILMSHLQANMWHKKKGDTFTMIAPSLARADGSKTWTFQIVDIIGDMPQASDGINFGNYEYFDKSRTLADQGKVMEIDFQASEPTRSPELAALVDRTFASSANPTQSTTEKMAYATSNNFGGLDVNALTRDIALAGIFMILLLVANGIAQSVRERFAEFATLKTIGFSDRAVLTMVALEAAFPCVVGSVLGVASAALLAHQLPSMMPPGFGLPMPTMAPWVFGLAALAAVAVALASASLPALRLKRMDIATALSGRT
jgi:putative ABC transport system permease protein